MALRMHVYPYVSRTHTSIHMQSDPKNYIVHLCPIYLQSSQLLCSFCKSSCVLSDSVKVSEQLLISPLTSFLIFTEFLPVVLELCYSQCMSDQCKIQLNLLLGAYNRSNIKVRLCVKVCIATNIKTKQSTAKYVYLYHL